MIINMIYGVAIISWLIIGVILCIAAGVTHDFDKRFFNPAWMIILGPLGFPVWAWVERKESKPRGKR